MFDRIGRPIEILLVEDSPADARLVVEGLKDSRIPCSLHRVEDGVEAMRFLRRQAPYADKPVPGLVLLDLNLPRKDGREVLAEMKADPDLHRIPVIVLSVSTSAEDIRRSYDLHANCYVSKPVDFDDFASVINAIETFWLTTNTLPPR